MYVMASTGYCTVSQTHSNPVSFFDLLFSTHTTAMMMTTTTTSTTNRTTTVTTADTRGDCWCGVILGVAVMLVATVGIIVAVTATRV